MSMRAEHEEVTVYAPATVANVGPGFDVLGLALGAPGDTVTARRVPGAPDAIAVTIRSIEGDGGVLPLAAEQNTAGIAALRTLERAGVPASVEIELRKGIPIGSGLGSSAASAAAAACAVNDLLGSPLRRAELIAPCVDAEAVVAGRHADNVAPAIVGGLILVRRVDPPAIVRIPLPEGLIVVTATPAYELPTRQAREALRDEIPLRSAVHNNASIAAFVSACYSGDLELLGNAIQDEIAAPVRLGLIPGGETVVRAALDAGALGASVSGAGPTIFAIAHSAAVAAATGAAMRDAFAGAGLDSTVFTSPANCPGARRL